MTKVVVTARARPDDGDVVRVAVRVCAADDRRRGARGVGARGARGVRARRIEQLHGVRELDNAEELAVLRRGQLVELERLLEREQRRVERVEHTRVVHLVREQRGAVREGVEDGEVAKVKTYDVRLINKVGTLVGVYNRTTGHNEIKIKFLSGKSLLEKILEE